MMIFVRALSGTVHSVGNSVSLCDQGYLLPNEPYKGIRPFEFFNKSSNYYHKIHFSFFYFIILERKQ
jgi:hypothetical protein